MNFKKNILLPLIGLVIALTSCNNKVYTEEENLNDWLKGRDYALNFDGTYTARSTVEDYYNGILEEKALVNESCDGERLYTSYVDYELNEENNNLEKTRDNLVAIKKVDDNGKKRNKYYVETTDEDGNTKKVGMYVAPDYAKGSRDLMPSAKEFPDLYVNGNTLEELKSNYNNDMFADKKEVIDTIELIRNKDKSVSLCITSSGEYVYSDEDLDDDYLKTIKGTTLEIIVKEERVTKIVSDIFEVNKFIDTSKESEIKSKTVINYEYTFDEKYYNQISVDTETTTNQYYGTVSFNVYGYNLTHVDYSTLVGDEYSVEKAREYLSSLYYVFIGNGTDFDSSYFSFYLDKDFTTPFLKVDSLEEEMTLYVQFNIPSTYSIVIYTFVDAKVENSQAKLKIVYLEHAGNIYNPKNLWSNYPILSIDGEKVSNEDDLTFTLAEGHIYIITCDSQGTYM